MSEPTRGIYEKFTVKRTDGKDGPGDKHDGCRYFVLDLSHDHHALRALRGYIDSCEHEYPLLADDLRRLANELPALRHRAVHPRGGNNERSV